MSFKDEKSLAQRRDSGLSMFQDVEGSGRCLRGGRGSSLHDASAMCQRSTEQRALWRLTSKAKSSCEHHLQSTQRKTQNVQNICLRVCTRGLKDQEKNLSPQHLQARKDAGGLNIPSGKVRGDTRATGKEGPLIVIRAVGPLERQWVSSPHWKLRPAEP